MIVGIDVGTQSLKAVVLSRDLEVLGKAAVAYAPAFPKPGWAEQDPMLWEEALRPAIAGALAEAGAAASDVKALGVAGQLDGCVATGEDGLPLHRCLIWMDRRAQAEVAGIDAALVGETCGAVLDASHPAAKMAWLKANRPETRDARCFHVPVSYLVSRLTGRNVVDHATASLSMLYGLHSRGYEQRLLDLFGVAREQLPAIAEADAISGPLTRQGEMLTGLPAGIPVAVGTGDDFSSALGAGVAKPGRLLVVLGTAEVVGALHPHAVIDAGRLVETHAFAGGQFFVENPGWLSGGALAWFRDTFRVVDFAELDTLAAEIAPGADGAIFIPALTGAMAPEWIASARGVFFGLTPSHGTGHLARAVLEGTSFAMRDVLERLRGLGIAVEALRTVGGGARSALWREIKADLVGLPVETPRQIDASPVGAGLLAGVAAGLLPDLHEAALRLDRDVSVIEPDPSKRAAYDEAYGCYWRVFDGLRPLFRCR